MSYRIGDRVRCSALGITGEVVGWDLFGYANDPKYFVQSEGSGLFWALESGLELVDRPAPARVPRGTNAPTAGQSLLQ